MPVSAVSTVDQCQMRGTRVTVVFGEEQGPSAASHESLAFALLQSADTLTPLNSTQFWSLLNGAAWGARAKLRVRVFCRPGVRRSVRVREDPPFARSVKS